MHVQVRTAASVDLQCVRACMCVRVTMYVVRTFLCACKCMCAPVAERVCMFVRCVACLAVPALEHSFPPKGAVGSRGPSLHQLRVPLRARLRRVFSWGHVCMRGLQPAPLCECWSWLHSMHAWIVACTFFQMQECRELAAEQAAQVWDEEEGQGSEQLLEFQGLDLLATRQVRLGGALCAQIHTQAWTCWP